MDIRERIRIARKARGLLQRELAELLHVRVPTISEWERGLVRPPKTRLAALAASLGVPTEFFTDDSLTEKDLLSMLEDLSPARAFKPSGRETTLRKKKDRATLPPDGSSGGTLSTEHSLSDVSGWKRAPVFSPAGIRELAEGKAMKEVQQHGSVPHGEDGEIVAMIFSGKPTWGMRDGDLVLIRLDYGSTQPGELYLVRAGNELKFREAEIRDGIMHPSREEIVDRVVRFFGKPSRNR